MGLTFEMVHTSVSRQTYLFLVEDGEKEGPSFRVFM